MLPWVKSNQCVCGLRLKVLRYNLNLSWLLFSSSWVEETSCVLVQTDILRDWVDCRGVSTVPCLRAMVNLTGSNQSTFLHLDEESVLLTLEVRIYQAFRAHLCP